MIQYKLEKEIQLEKLIALYEDVGWTSYTQDLSVMEALVPNAYQVIAAWNEEELVGLIRSISDGVYILYIQDLLVRKSYQGKGIGSKLLKRMIQENINIRQKVLLTECEEKIMSFYEKNGFGAADNKDLGVAFVRYDQ